MARLMGFVGILALLGIAWLMSDNKKKINLRTVGVGLSMQFFLGVLELPRAGLEVLASTPRDDLYVGGAEPLGLFHGVFLAEIGKHDHRSFPYLIVGANLLECFKAVYARQNKIKEDDVRLPTLKDIKSGFCLNRVLYFKSVRKEFAYK